MERGKVSRTHDNERKVQTLLQNRNECANLPFDAGQKSEDW